MPSVSWSSRHPLNVRPRIITLGMLCIGLVIFGLGEALLIAAGTGVSPWTVFAQGLGLVMSLSIGWATFVVSAGVLLFWVPLKQVPGIGTILNAVIISAVIGSSLPYLPKPAVYGLQVIESVIGILMVGFGSGLYLIAHLGAGPRDGLMTGLQRVTDLPIAWVRTSIEIIVVLCGWLLGGTVGLGTVLFAFGIGPSLALSILVLTKLFSPKVNE